MSISSQINRIASACDAQTVLIRQIKEELQGKTAGGSEDLDAVLTEQEALIERLKETLREKASGGTHTPDVCPLITITIYGLDMYEAYVYRNNQCVFIPDYISADESGVTFSIENVDVGWPIIFNYASSTMNTGMVGDCVNVEPVQVREYTAIVKCTSTDPASFTFSAI
jgi:hypothetical protein